VLSYIVKRILSAIPVLFIVVTAVFFAFKLIPGDPAIMYAGEQADPETLERIRHEMGLDRPVLVQYTQYISRLVRGDLGKSFVVKKPVAGEVLYRFQNTLKLSVVAIIIAILAGIAFGLISAIKYETGVDYFFTVLSISGISIPVFWLAMLLMYVFSVRLRLLPMAGSASWKNFIMPSICLAAYSVAFITRMTRSALLELMGDDFVRTARAKGVKERLVLFRHILRNALIPIITIVGLRFGYMLGGAIITETVFAWPGMGRLLVMSVKHRDIPMIQGCLLVFAVSFVLVNLIVELIYGVVDPRVRYKMAGKKLG
jgi:ABC-type dipeptide/oligopeptide/nickel transport system permease component